MRSSLRRFISTRIAFAIVVSGVGMAQSAKPAASDVVAEELMQLLNTPVVSASKVVEKASEAPATIYVIREEDIARNGYLELKDALENVPGFTAIDLGFFLFGGQRGFLGNLSQTLILVNGREMQNLIAAETFISHQFATHNIKQIEVIQGPGSALYGANALVGVINILTKDQSPDFQGVEASTDFGSNNTSAVNAVFSIKSGDWKLSGSVRAYRSDGSDLSHFVNDPTRFSEGFADYQKAHLDGDHRFHNAAQSQPYAFRLDYLQFYAGLEGFRLQTRKGLENVSLDYESQSDRRELDLTYAGWADALGSDTDLSVEIQHYKERFWGVNYNFSQTIYTDIGYTAPQTISDTDVHRYFSDYYSQENSPGSTRDKVTAQITHRFKSGGNLVAGLVYDQQDVMGIALSDSDPTPSFDTTLSDSNRLHRPFYKTDKKSAFAQYKQGFLSDSLLMTVGARLDRQSVYGSIHTFRGGLVWRYSAQGTAKALFGQAFREPNIFEQGAHVDEPPNTSLQPAKMDTYELSVNQGIGSFMVGNFTVYRNLAHALIVPRDTVHFTNSNSTKAVTGAEAQLAFLFSQAFKGDLGYAYTDAGSTRYAGEWIKNLGVYRHSLSAGLNYDYSTALRFNVRVNHYTSMEAMHGNPAILRVIDLPSATKMSFTISGEAPRSQKLNYMLTVRNALDADIYQPNVRTGGPKQFMQPGREIYGRIGIRF